MTGLRLRPITRDDWRTVHDWARRPESSRFQVWGPNTEAQTRDFVTRAVTAWTVRPIRDRLYLAELDDTVIGSGVLHIRDRAHAQGEITYLVHPDHWGGGLGTALARELLRVGFAELGLHRVVGTCDPRNTASAAVLRRVGMTREGRMRHTVRLADGWRDSDLYSILEPEWTVA